MPLFKINMPDSTHGRVDLHTHSTASDGEFSPAELAQLALARGLSAIALTDHDTVAGLDAAIAAARGTPLEVVPGVELSCDVPQTEVHVLGYFIDWHDTYFESMLEKFRDGRYGARKRW